MTCHLLYWYFNFDCIFYTHPVHVDSIYSYMVEYGNKKKQFEKKFQTKKHIYFKKGITKQSKQFVDRFIQSSA